MPGRACTICSHAKREQAERMLAFGHSVRETARQLKLPYQSLDRHQRNCVRQALEQAASARGQALAESHAAAAAERGAEIRGRVEELHSWTLALFHEARDGRVVDVPATEEGGTPKKLFLPPDPKEARLALGTARKNLELIARLSGALDPTESDERAGITFEEFEVMYKRRRLQVR